MTDQSATFIDIIKDSISDKHKITIMGGGSKSFLGRQMPPSNNIIQTTAHSGILSYEPVELVMRARSGTSLLEIEEALSAHNQCLSSEAPIFEGKATIGGSLAANMSGPARPWSGSLRDHILGVSLINGEAKHLKFGGQVMKNVAGYDVSRLQAGAMGTLGLMTDISFKVMPKYKFEHTYSDECSASEALTICNQIASSEKPILSASWFAGKLHLRFATMENAIVRSVGEVPGKEMSPQKSQEFWHQIREFKHPFFRAEQGEEIWRISVKSSAPFPKDVSGEWAFDWGGSLRWLKTRELEKEILNNWSTRYGAEYIRWAGGNRSDHLHPQISAPMRQIRQNIKKALDPHSLFNPGRLFEWM